MANRYHEKIVVFNGGIVSRCWECKQLNGLRFVTQIRNLAAGTAHEWKDKHTYRLCDRCADREIEIYRRGGAEVIDGRDDFFKKAA